MIVKKSCDYVHDFVKAGAGKEKARGLNLGLGNT